ncbi:MAG: hypothetical protein IJ642_07400 [Oscillospiraceae bacterium]|nr:hypothetical protein [Oscillospiraceae bacterium]
MTDEQRKEICKAFFYRMTIKEIAGAEQIDAEEIAKAIRWGEITGYTSELKGRVENNAERN